MAVLEEFEEAFGTTVFEGYGLSETSPTATRQPAVVRHPGRAPSGTRSGASRSRSPAETVEDRIELLAAGELGEIVIRGHNVFAGYLDDPEATAAGDRRRLVPHRRPRAPRTRTGFITIVDRKKDLIIRGGFNVYPREVEEVLARHPAVAQVAVIGVPDPETGRGDLRGRRGRRPARAADADELVAWARERLGRHKYPRVVHFVDELPLGPSHKVLKRELRTRFR